MWYSLARQSKEWQVVRYCDHLMMAVCSQPNGGRSACFSNDSTRVESEKLPTRQGLEPQQRQSVVYATLLRGPSVGAQQSSTAQVGRRQ